VDVTHSISPRSGVISNAMESAGCHLSVCLTVSLSLSFSSFRAFFHSFLLFLACFLGASYYNCVNLNMGYNRPRESLVRAQLFDVELGGMVITQLFGDSPIKENVMVRWLQRVLGTN
jgi:hypothetical protein